VVLLLGTAVAGVNVDGHAFALGMVAGVGGAFGLASFYRALAVGTVSVVAPIAATGAVVPLLLALAAGDDPRALALVGVVVALAGAVMASLEERAAEEVGRRDAIALAAAAAVLIGLFLFFLGRGSQHGGTLSALLGARAGSMPLLIAWAAITRTSLAFGRDVPRLFAVGLLDVTANALFALASREGLLAIVSVLGSLYPVPTVILAHVVLRERISAFQRAGIAVALGGVALVAANG
jgi:drug/metabolite transporter (DMT)-like permease